jgi:hypothetical protein
MGKWLAGWLGVLGSPGRFYLQYFVAGLKVINLLCSIATRKGCRLGERLATLRGRKGPRGKIQMKLKINLIKALREADETGLTWLWTE